MIEISNTEIVNTAKLLLYKESPSIFKKLDFEDDNIFLEPLVFSYFNAKADKLNLNISLKEILQAYFKNKEPLIVENSFNKNGIAYIPEIGYFKKGQKEPYEPILKIGDFEILKEVHPTQEQQEIIDEYVHNCAKKYSYKFQHHKYQECLDQGIKEDPNISYLWQPKAMPYFKARKYEVGMNYLDKAVKINRVGYLSYIGFIHCIFAKNFHEAIEDFKEIKAIEGNSIVMDHSYNFYLGLSHLQLNNFEKAEQLFQQDVHNQVEKWGKKEYHHLAMFYLAVSKYEQKKWEDANQDFDKTLEKYPTFSDAMYYKSICLYQLDRNEEYYTWYEKAKENGKAGNTIYEDNSIYENYPYQILWN